MGSVVRMICRYLFKVHRRVGSIIFRLCQFMVEVVPNNGLLYYRLFVYDQDCGIVGGLKIMNRFCQNSYSLLLSNIVR